MKGKPFAPDERMKKILTEAAAVGDATARAIMYRWRGTDGYWYPNSNWRLGFVGGYKFEENGARLLNAYSGFFFYATGITPAMDTKMVRPDRLVDRRLGDDARQMPHVLHVLAVEIQDDVAVLDPRLLGRAACRDTAATIAPCALSMPSLSAISASPSGCDAEPAAPRMAEVLQLRDDVLAMLAGIEKPMPIDPPDGE